MRQGRLQRPHWMACAPNQHTHTQPHTTRTHAHRLLWGRRSGWVGAGMSRDGHDLVYTIDSPGPSPSPHPLLHVGLVGEQTWDKAAAERACACGCRSLLLLLLLLCLAPISRCINRDQWREEALKIRQKCVLGMGAGGCRAFATFSLPNLVVVVLRPRRFDENKTVFEPARKAALLEAAEVGHRLRMTLRFPRFCLVTTTQLNMQMRSGLLAGRVPGQQAPRPVPT